MSSWPGIFLITVTFRERDGNPVHRSHYNPANKEPILRVKVMGSKGTKKCQVYADGTGTTSITDVRE